MVTERRVLEVLKNMYSVISLSFKRRNEMGTLIEQLNFEHYMCLSGFESPVSCTLALQKL